MNNLDRVVATVGLGPTSPLLGAGDDSIPGVVVQGARALDVWSALKSPLLAEGHWPVIVGDDDSVTYLQENWDTSGEATTSTFLEKAATVDVEAWLAERCESDEAYYEEVHGPWPKRPAPSTNYVIPTDFLTGGPLERVYLAVVPTADSWAVPAYLRLGGWNECPFPHEHVAVLRYWFGRYGGELVGLSIDTIECAVGAPPNSKEAALLLARQQFAHCPDIVGQGCLTLENLGAALLKAPVWYFWWD